MTAPAAATLNVAVVVTQAGAKAALMGLTKGVEGFGAAAAKAGTTAARSFSSVGGEALKAARSMAALVTGVAGLATVAKGFELGDRMAELADQTQLTAQQINAFVVTMGNSGVAETKAVQGLQRLTAALVDARDPTTEAAALFARLGINAQQVSNLPTAKRLDAVAAALANVQDPAERTALAMQLMGGAGARMLPVLVGMQGGLTGVADAAAKADGALTELDFAQISTANTSIDKARASFMQMAGAIASELSPAVAYLADRAALFFSTIADERGTMKEFGDNAIKAFGYATGGINALVLGVDALRVASAGIGVGFWEAVRVAAKAFSFVEHFIGNTFDVIKDGGEVMWRSMVVVWQSIKSSAVMVFGEIQTEFGKTIRAMGDAAAGTGVKGLADIGRGMQDAGGALIVGAAKLQGGAQADVKAARDALGKSVNSLNTSVNLLRGTTANSLNAVDDIVDAAYGINKSAAADASAALTKLQNGGVDYADQEKARFDKWSKTFQDNAEKEKQMRIVNAQGNVAATAGIEYDAQVESMTNLLNFVTAGYQAINDVKMGKELEYQAFKKQLTDQMNKEEEEAAWKNRAMWESGWNGKLSVLGDVLNQMSGLMNSKNRQMFEVGKAAAIGSTVIATYESATQAYKALAGIPIVGPALGAAAAGAAIANGLGNVARIKATSFGGGSGGGAAGSQYANPGVKGDGSQYVEPSNNTYINVQGERFGANQVRDLAKDLAKARGDNVVVN